MIYEIHYSENILKDRAVTNPTLREMMSDVWRFQKFEAASEELAVKKLYEEIGEDQVNYILSITPIQ